MSAMAHVDRRPREPSNLRVVLVDGDVQSTGHVADQSESGLLVRGPIGLVVGRHLSVVRVLQEAEGATRPAVVVRTDEGRGAGLRFLRAHEAYATPDAPLLYLAEAWDDEDGWLAPLPAPVVTSARFAVRPSSVERLRRFVDRDLAAGTTMLFSSELRTPGERVAVVLVHPVTGAELDLPAVVLRCEREARPHLELAFIATDVVARIEVARFVETGDPCPRILPPVPDLERENEHLRERIARLEQAVAWATEDDRAGLRGGGER
ncbi:MAG: PilZ domain-containing protein [Deltaproteobacteria bacterium]|nr:PilZ domain-containing protein [Deltaproteobacteria bacterium]